MANPNGTVWVVSSAHVVKDKSSLSRMIRSVAEGAWQDFKTTNRATAGKAVKTGLGLAVAGKTAAQFESLTPLQWMIHNFGPLPAEFTKSGSIQVFEFSTLERSMLVAKSTAANFVLVTVAYEGGVLIGSFINQALPESTKDAIGGTINEIVNEGGWKELFKHPFGIGL